MSGELRWWATLAPRTVPFNVIFAGRALPCYRDGTWWPDDCALCRPIAWGDVAAALWPSGLVLEPGPRGICELTPARFVKLGEGPRELTGVDLVATLDDLSEVANSTCMAGQEICGWLAARGLKIVKESADA